MSGFGNGDMGVGELAALYNVATDEELHVLDRMAVRAGLIWICPVASWNNDKGEACGDCGMTEDEAKAYAKMSPEDQEAYDEAREPDSTGGWDGSAYIDK